ncbi:receptor protein kinase [Tanacetum coccineum]
MVFSYLDLIAGGIGRPEFGSLLREDVQSGDVGLRSLPLEDRVSYYSVRKKRKRRERRKVISHFVSPHGIAAEDVGSGGARTEGVTSWNTLGGLGLARVFTLPIKKYTNEVGQSKETFSKVHYVELILFLEPAYLQEAIEPKVVHRDIKSSHLLIEAEFNAKLHMQTVDF